MLFGLRVEQIATIKDLAYMDSHMMDEPELELKPVEVSAHLLALIFKKRKKSKFRLTNKKS